MALTFASYVLPRHAHLVAPAAVVALTAVNFFGVRASAWVTRAIVAITLVALTLVVIACLAGGTADLGRLTPFPGASAGGILQAAGLLFFAFAGYARIATLGEEVREPARTIPRVILIALGLTLVVYTLVAFSALLAVGADGLASAAAPLGAATAAGSLHALTPAVRVGGAVASLGALLALMLGVSRTTLAMARDRRLPKALDAVHPRHGVPHRAELAIGVLVAALAASVDLRGAIGFSSFGVLVYYAIANASASTLRREEHRPPRGLPVLGLIGCMVLAFSLPTTSIVAGVAVLAAGALLWVLLPPRPRRRVPGETHDAPSD
jgi:APA family basic amino acid/polyamine antiporter